MSTPSPDPNQSTPVEVEILDQADPLVPGVPNPLALNKGPLTAPQVVELLRFATRGKSPATLLAYSQDLRAYQHFCGDPTPQNSVLRLLMSEEGAGNYAVTRWAMHMEEAGLAPATIARRLGALKCVLREAKRFGMISWVLDVPAPKAEGVRDTRGPGKSAFEAMIRVLDGLILKGDSDTRKRAVRNRAIVRLLFDRALRRNEAVSLDLEHLDLDGRTLMILGKGRRKRELITLPEVTGEALWHWVVCRGLAPGPLFTSMNPSGQGDGRLTGRSVGRIVNELGERAGITRRVHAHGLRHSAITEALDRTDGNVRAVQKFSRHRSVQTLLVYDDNQADLGGQVASVVVGEGELGSRRGGQGS